VTSRRDALARLFATAAAAIAAACDQAIARLRGRKLVPIATLDQVPVGSAYRRSVGDDPLILVNDGGEIRTFAAVCTHEGCPLGWNQTQHLIRCPCHGSAFDTHGRVVNGPAVLPLTRLETVTDGGRILLVVRNDALRYAHG
jgi:Rieske Fe-S protein